jgi:hypothetical protein
VTDARSQALALDYVIGLGVALVLTMGLLVAAGGFIGDQREAAARSQLEVVGQQVAADVESADRLAAAVGTAGTVRIDRVLPGTIAGSLYRIELVESADPTLELRTVRTNTTATVEFTNTTAVTASDVGGGRIAINYTADAIRLEEGGP